MKPLRQFEPSRLQRWTALLFVVLMAGFGFVQAVHVHVVLAGQAAPSSHCSVCIAAHNAVLISPSSTATVPVVATALLEASEPQLQSRLQVASAFIRPPPPSL